MTRYQVVPLIVFLAMLAACTVLLILKLPEPAVFVALLAGAGQSLLPSVSNRTNVQAALASIAPPPLPMAPEQIAALKASLHPPPLPPPPPSDPQEHP